MERTPSTPSAEELPASGAEHADTLYRTHLETARTLGEVRADLDRILLHVGDDAAAHERVKEIEQAVDSVSEGGVHDGVQLDGDLGEGVLGTNNLGTRESHLRRDQLDPDAVIEDTRDKLDTVLHEDSEEDGHAGQDPRARVAIIGMDGKPREETVVFEGNVVANVSRRLGQRREGLPEETYLEGVRLVQDIGPETVDSYVRKDGANVGKPLQIEVWRKRPSITVQEMLEQGRAVGMSEREVLAAARVLGKFKGSLAEAHHALAA